VSWIWGGVVLIVLGTLVALVPSLKPVTSAVRTPVRTEQAEPALKGGD
jgi:cytochrome c-type biogenesis protein CcmF